MGAATRLDAGRAGHANRFLDVGVHRLRKFLRAVAGRLEALLSQEFLDFGRLERLHDGPVELVDDRPRCPGRRQHAVPARHLIVGQAGFGDGRDIRRDLEPFAGGDAERPHRTGADLRQRGDRRVEERGDFARHHRLLRLGHAAIGDVSHLHAGGGEEKLGSEMRKASDADRGVVELLLAGELDQFLDRLRGRRIRHQQDLADLRHHRNRREILFAVVGQTGVERGIGGMAREHHQQGVAVGIGDRRRPRSIVPPAPGRFSITTAWPS